MVSASTPLLWVPLATAAVGLVTGLGAGLGAAVLTQRRTDRREDVKWQRERDDRQEQWHREDSLRWLQDRQQAYARLIAALYEWDGVLRSAMASRKNDMVLNERTDLDTAEMWRIRRAARETLPVVQFMAPQNVRSLAWSAVRDRESFWIINLAPPPNESFDPAGTDASWRRLSKKTASLHEAMRNDLGLESTAEDTEQPTGG